MINFFDKLYSSISYKNKTLSKLRFYSVLRFIIRLSANFVLPLYYFLFQNKNNSLIASLKTENRIIVSLTSFPSRINRLWIVIESLLRQTRKPDKIILWLSIEQFSDISSLPRKLVKMQNRGLEIRFCEGNLRSHKKYFFALKEFSKDFIITVDDDVFYNSKILEYLIGMSNKYPNSICCNEASYINIKNGIVQPYINWLNVLGEKEPNEEIMPIGVGGVLYPPNSLHSDVLNKELFMSMCFLADDIWLNIMARLIGTKVAKTKYNSSYIPVMNFKNQTLNSINVNQGQNDKQLKSVRDYYISNYKIDPYRSKS
jgi:hypothetical protein